MPASVDKWVAQFKAGIDVLGRRDEALRTLGLGGEHPWNLSLFESVTRDPTGTVRLGTLYVKWTYPQSLLGRKVRLDVEGVLGEPPKLGPYHILAPALRSKMTVALFEDRPTKTSNDILVSALFGSPEVT